MQVGTELPGTSKQLIRDVEAVISEAKTLSYWTLMDIRILHIAQVVHQRCIHIGMAPSGYHPRMLSMYMGEGGRWLWIAMGLRILHIVIIIINLYPDTLPGMDPPGMLLL